jgi:hypothetical protein
MSPEQKEVIEGTEVRKRSDSEEKQADSDDEDVHCTEVRKRSDS